jgi:hypothetical protein
MCVTIVINRGEKEIESPRQFKEHFGFEPFIEDGYKTIELDACLCQVDVEKSLNAHNIPFKWDCMDYYVGDLENFKEDFN